MTFVSIGDLAANQPGVLDLAKPARPLRSFRRAAQWASAINRAYYYLSSRVSEPTAQAALDRYYERAMKDGPDFMKVRATADFSRVQVERFDKAKASEIMKQARQIEYESYKTRAKGKHGGQLGRTAIVLLEWFCFVFWPRAPHGMFPSIAHICAGARMSRQTVVNAIKTLKLFGFLDVQPRRKVIDTPLGEKVVQATNCYVLKLVEGLGALALQVFSRKGIRSESSKQPAKETHIYNSNSVEPESGPRSLAEIAVGNLFRRM